MRKSCFIRKLRDLFITFENAKLNKQKKEEILYGAPKNDLFCIKNLEEDTGYKPLKTFDKFAFEFFNK